MEFHEKLQELRKQKGLTQDELADILFVSRTAVSKWESGRGLPNIDSLKAISAYFSITLDELLSGGELLTIAENDHKQREYHTRDLVFGLLDCSSLLWLFLPLFGQTANGAVKEVSLLALTGISPYLHSAYLIAVIGMTVIGVLTLALQNCRLTAWMRYKSALSLGVHLAATCLFILSRQVYAAIFLFVFLTIKMLLKKR